LNFVAPELGVHQKKKKTEFMGFVIYNKNRSTPFSQKIKNKNKGIRL